MKTVHSQIRPLFIPAATLLLAILAWFSGQVHGAVIAQLGDQDFAEGDEPLLTTYLQVSAGEPIPFDSFRGSDLVAAGSFSENWIFSFEPGLYVGALVTLGLYDHDSQAPGNQVAFFGVNGHDLTDLLNAQLELSGGQQSEYNIYTIAMPNASLPSLSGGSATFSLTLQGPGIGFLSDPPELTPNNGAGLDFSRLTLEVPEPGSMILLVVGGICLIADRRRFGAENQPTHLVGGTRHARLFPSQQA